MSWRLTFLAAVAIVAIAGVAIAAQSGSENVVLCAAKRGGALRLASKGKCAKAERELTIAKQGPQGAPGATGAQGAPGTTASIQPEAVRLVGPARADCEDVPGNFCGSGGLDWANAGSVDAPAGYWKDAAGEIHLMGTAKGTTGGGGITSDLFYLPESYRPVGTRQFAIPDCVGEIITVQIEANGSVHLPFVPPDRCVALDGVSFRP